MTLEVRFFRFKVWRFFEIFKSQGVLYKAYPSRERIHGTHQTGSLENHPLKGAGAGSSQEVIFFEWTQWWLCFPKTNSKSVRPLKIGHPNAPKGNEETRETIVFQLLPSLELTSLRS